MNRSANPLYDVRAVTRYRRDRKVIVGVVVGAVAFIVAFALTFAAIALAMAGVL